MEDINLSPKTKNSSYRLGRIEKQILLTLLANDEQPLTASNIHSYIKGYGIVDLTPDGKIRIIPMVGYSCDYDYPSAQMYQAIERLYNKGLLIASEKKGCFEARQVLLTEKGREKALEIYNVMMEEINPFLNPIVRIKNLRQ
jgi:hypothetical protein